MPIAIHEQTFHLYNDTISYIMRVTPGGDLEHLYFGPRLPLNVDPTHLSVGALYGNQVADQFDPTVSLESRLREYPNFGTGDMRAPAYTASVDGSAISTFSFVDATVTTGKPAIPGLPATYVEEAAEADTLSIELTDDVTQCSLTLQYTIYAQRNVVTRHASFTNHGPAPVTLSRALSLCLDLPDQDYVLTTLMGGWARERQVTTRKLQLGTQAIGSQRGHSSAQANPFLALARPNATQQTGEVIGFSFVYSGNFTASVEADAYDHTRVLLGIAPEQFSWPLAPKQAFTTPEAVMAYSPTGYNGMSQTFHSLYNERLVRGAWRMQPRPILLNNWEGTYFDFDEPKLLALAAQAQAIGVELFVLDDGWFGHRDNDRSSLGDWVTNRAKLPAGLPHLVEQITALGLKFGLWFEPEMVSPDSDLYRAHPDWVLGDPNRPRSLGRHQYVLDLSQPAVVDYLFTALDSVLQASPISYVKWDMNRSLTEVFSAAVPASEQGTIAHRFILGVYALYERLRHAHPDILFESCASGGGRFDPGMLYYAPQAWTSDDTDAIARQSIQYGTSYVYPIASMGSHVSAVPNEQLHRTTPLATRAAVAYFGTFGYELDLTKLTAATLATLAEQVAFMKAHRELLQFGRFYRLSEPEDPHPAWLVVDDNADHAIMLDCTQLQQPDATLRFRRLAGLTPTAQYRSDTGEIYSGAELIAAGIRIDERRRGDFSTMLLTLDKIAIQEDEHD